MGRGAVRGVTWAVAGSFAMLLLLATALAATTWQRPFPSLFVDPFGTFSVVFLPSWGTESLGLAYPDRIVEIGGEPVGGVHRADALERAVRAGADHVDVRFASPGREAHVRAAVRRIGGAEIWCFFGVYALLGLAFVSFGLAVFILAPEDPATRALLVPTLSAGAFFVTFYDYHTTRWLVPLFSAASVVTPLALVWLTLCFPRRPAWLGSRAEVAYGSAVGAAAFALAIAPTLGYDAELGRRAVSIATPGSLVVLAAAIVARRWRSRGRIRVELTSVLVGLSVLPVIVGIAILPTILFGTSATLHLMLPIAALAIPVSIGAAIVRHNAFRTKRLLSRQVVGTSIAFVALAAGGTGTLLVLAFYGEAARVPGLAVGALLAAVVYGCASVAIGRWVFPAGRHFRPTIEQLADVVTSVRSRDEVSEVVREHVRSWLPTLSVDVLSRAELEASCAAKDLAKLRDGRVAWSDDDVVERSLFVPMRSLGELHGALRVAPKDGGAVYTTEDVALLQTVASVGAISLHHAVTLDELRRQKAMAEAAAKEDKHQTIELLAAEVSHELRYPINYFRHLLRQAGRGEPLDHDDVDVGREELDRMERMLSTLARVKRPAPRRTPTRAGDVLRRAVAIVESDAREAGVELRVHLPDAATIDGDADALLQLSANLVRNAVQHAGRGGRVDASVVEDGSRVVLSVEDSGPGVDRSVRDRLFDPWVSASPGGSGLGLAVAMRIARSFGGTLAIDDGSSAGTRFVASFPRSKRTEQREDE